MTEESREMVRFAYRLMIRRQMLLLGVVVAGIGAAVFEGGTMGLLGLAVSVLVGEGSATGWIPDALIGYVGFLFESRSNEGLFLLLIGIAVIAQIFRSILTYISQVTEVYLTAEMSREARQIATRHAMSLSYGEISKFPPGKTAILIEQADFVTQAVNQVSSISRATLMLIAYSVVMLMMSITMTMVTVVVVVLLWLSLTRVVQKLRELSDETTSAKVNVWRWSIEYLNAPRLLRVFDGTGHATEVINKARDSEIFPERKSNVILAAIKPAMETITIFGAGLFLIIGYFFAGSGAAPAIAKLFVFVLIFYRLKPQISAFNDFRIKIAQLLPVMDLVGKFLSSRGKEFTSLGGQSFRSLTRGVVFDNVCYRYPGTETDVLRNVSFNIPVGQTVALVGMSGGGKSTTADLLLGLYTPTVGSILIDDSNLELLDQSDWRRKIGVVDQEVFLLNASVRENIGFARPWAEKHDIEEAARIAHAHEFIEALQEGYDTIIGNRGYKLSGGQQQRLALARALLGNPEILILDEATSSLDTISERLIQRALEGMHNNKTILVIAHRLSTITSADYIIVLDQGEIKEKGTKDQLLKRGGLFSRLWSMQADSTI